MTDPQALQHPPLTGQAWAKYRKPTPGQQAGETSADRLDAMRVESGKSLRRAASASPASWQKILSQP